MMAGSGSAPAAAGGPARHIPVLGRRAVDLLAVRESGVYVDATFGPGGYTRAEGLDPDLITIGKPIAGGVPTGAYGMSDEMAAQVLEKTKRLTWWRRRHSSRLSVLTRLF